MKTNIPIYRAKNIDITEYDIHAKNAVYDKKIEYSEYVEGFYFHDKVLDRHQIISFDKLSNDEYGRDISLIDALTLKISFDDGETWYDVEEFTNTIDANRDLFKVTGI